MGLAVVHNGTPTKSRKTIANAIPTKSGKTLANAIPIKSNKNLSNAIPIKSSSALPNAGCGTERKPSRSFRKGWTLFILKQNESCDAENSPVDAPIKHVNCPCQSVRSDQQAIESLPGSEDYFKARDEKSDNVAKPAKERIRGLTAIIQDVLSRSRSDLRRDYGMKSQEDHLTAQVVGIETGVVVGSNESPEMSLSFRMRLVDRCDTDIGVVASIRNGTSKSIASEASQSCRYPLKRQGEGASIADLLKRETRLGMEDNSRGLSTMSSTTDEYECVVKRLRDARGTIRLLAAMAVREATRNSPQAREDLWKAGAIPPLVNLLQEQDMGVCYMATVALLNLAIGSVRNKQQMADCGAIPILVRLMRPESTTTVRESATTVILSLAASDQLKPCLGSSGAIVYLSDILTNGTTQGRSDVVRALLNLSIFKGNRSVIVQAGVIGPLYKVILRDAKETAEKAVILLSHLFQDREGRETITANEQSCSVLLEVLKRGTFSQTCKEQTVVILLALSAKMAVRREAVFAQGIIPSLVEISLIASNQKIQEKAAKLLKIIKEQRMDQGILSMDRVSVTELADHLPFERQNSSSSTVDSCITVPSSRRRVACSSSSLSAKGVQFTPKEPKESKNLSYVRSFFARSLKFENLTCRAVSVEEPTRVPVKLMRSFCSQ